MEPRGSETLLDISIGRHVFRGMQISSLRTGGDVMESLARSWPRLLDKIAPASVQS